MSDLITTTARVHVLARDADDMPPRETLMALASARASDPAVFDEAPPVFFMVDASNDQLDSHYTQMDRTTLENFAADAADGVAVLKSHSTRDHYGSSLTGEVVKNGDITAMRSVFFTIPGVADEQITMIRAGIYKDISVGFRVPADGMITCSICGGNMMDWSNCTHWPGRSYEVEEKGKKTPKLATGRVVGGRLSEYSTVYDGSTPGAGVVKGLRMAEAGEMSPELAATLERTYHRSFPVHRSYAVPEIGTSKHERKGSGDMAELADTLRSILGDRGFHIRSGSDDTALTDALKSHLADLDREAASRDEDLRVKDAEIAALKPKAEDGERYREDTIETALKNYVRTFKPEDRREVDTGPWKRAFEAMDIGDILRISADWENRAIFEPGSGAIDANEDGDDPQPANQNGNGRKVRTAASVHQDV